MGGREGACSSAAGVSCRVCETESGSDGLARKELRDLSHKGEWETGQFDRVVFTGEGAERAAVIYDFKTNALRTGDSAEAFEQRMCQTYMSQMNAYRAALGALTGLPASRIRSVLLLQSTESAVECGA